VKTIYPSDWTERTGSSSPSIRALKLSEIIFSVGREFVPGSGTARMQGAHIVALAQTKAVT